MPITLLQEQAPPKSLQDDARGFHRFVMTPLLLLPWRERAREPRRVGIVLDRPSAPPWVTALADSLKPFDVRFFALSRDTASGARRSGWLADRLCELSKRKFDPYTETPVECGHLAAASCDILIWLAGSGVNTPPTALAPCGALSVRFGDKPGGTPFFDEGFEGNPCTKVFVRWHDVSFSRARSLREAELSTAMGLYFTRNAEGPLTAAVRMLAWLCAGIGYEESLSLDRLRALPDEDVELARRTEWPSNFDTGHFIAKKLLRRARLHREAAGRVPWWSVWMRPKAGGSFRELPLGAEPGHIADPFLHQKDGRTWLLYEEMPARTSKGVLRCVELDAAGAPSAPIPILEADQHLSYPCLIDWHGETFLLPESSDARRVDLLRFTRFPDQVETVANLADGVRLVDTTPVLIDAVWYFFTTTVKPFMETFLFVSDRLDGAWQLHPASPISSSVRNSRCAGNLYWKDGRLYRVTQDCSVRYGYAMTVNEVTRLTPAEFEERTVRQILPDWAPGLLGTHTWNETSRWQVIDGLRF